MSVADLLLFGVLFGVALEDMRLLSVPREPLLLAWGALGVWQIVHGHFLAVLSLLPLTVWGLGYGPGRAALAFLPFFPYWPVLLLGAGAREGWVGDGDVLAISLAALLSPWAGWAGFVGMMLWHAWQRRQGALWGPGIPGLLLGVTAYLLLGGFIHV